jgi:hypothetical protein
MARKCAKVCPNVPSNNCSSASQAQRGSVDEHVSVTLQAALSIPLPYGMLHDRARVVLYAFITHNLNPRFELFRDVSLETGMFSESVSATAYGGIARQY